MTLSDNWLQTPIARYVWNSRYRWRGAEVEDDSIEATWQRVAQTVAAVEQAEREVWQARFFALMRGFDFIPGGRILAGAGVAGQLSLFNCFVMSGFGRDTQSIFDTLKQAALTMQAGGGVGFDFSALPPQAAASELSRGITPGVVAYMRIWDTMCATIRSGGSRRGAMMATLRCDHPDIEAFVNAKRAAGELSHFNLSVQVSDEFMRAVDSDQEWPLLFPLHAGVSSASDDPRLDWPGYHGPVACRVVRRVAARDLWRQIMQAAYDCAEPGVLFVDRINEFNNLSYREQITTTNPCGEIPLPDNGACNLGSINLSRFVIEPFTAKARLDLERIGQAAQIAVRLLDNVIDCSYFPLPAQAEQAKGSRRIGLGITGLGDSLFMLGLCYADEAARREAARAMQTICHAAYHASVELAREKGPFEFFRREDYLQGRFIRALPRDIQEAIAHHGIRNSHLTAIAPAGTISLLANNISSGIEPVFDLIQQRRIREPTEEYASFVLQDDAYRRWRELNPEVSQPPPEFVTAQQLEPQAHLLMQAELQAYVDSAIAKTINIPQSCSFADFSKLYRDAWELGLKGCTLFRGAAATEGIVSSAPVCCDADNLV